MPLFPDPKAAGSRCTLGPPSPAWAGLVLAASALPPAGRPRRIPCLRCPDPAPPEQRAALSITGSRGLRAPILLHCPSDPPSAASEPRTVKGDALFLWAGLGSAVSLHLHRPHLHPIPSLPESLESWAEAGGCSWAPPGRVWGDRSPQGLRRVDFISTLVGDTELPALLSPGLPLCPSFLT